jgi:alpha-tubulin suppressor-like RCC1 family protein
VISLVASPAGAYRFVNWTGDVGTIAAINNATTVTMSGNYSITANFARISPMVAAGWYHTVGLKSEAIVVAVGRNRYGKCSAGGWDLT